MVRVPVWEQNISDLPGASRYPHATAETFGYDIGTAQKEAGAHIAKGLNTLGDALTAQADEQEAIKSKVTLSDHETAVNLHKMNLIATTPAADAARIPDMVQEFANSDWAERRNNIGGKYQSIADSHARIYWNKSYVQNQVQSVKSYYDAVNTQVTSEVSRQGMLVFADPGNIHAAAGAVSAYVNETNIPPDLKRSMLVEAASTLQSQVIAGYKLRIQNAANAGNVQEALKLQGEAAAAASNLPGQLTEALGINRLPKVAPPPAIQPGAPVTGPQYRIPGRRSDAGATATQASLDLGPGDNKPIQIAASLLGKHEVSHRQVISEFIGNIAGRKVDPATTAWCAAFVNAVLRRSGQPGSDSLAARSLLKVGTPVDQPQVGDIVVFSRGPGHGHVGFYAGRNSDGTIKVLGGNQGDTVSIKTFGTGRVLGYRRIGPLTRQQTASVSVEDTDAA